MKASTPKAQAQALPIFSQAVALALAKAQADLECMIKIRCADEHWDDCDNDIDFAVELTASHIARMKTMDFADSSAFEAEWFKAAGALNLGRKTFSRSSCAFGMMLAHMCALFEQMAAMVEFVERQNG